RSLAPAVLVRRIHPDERAQVPDLPDAVFLDVVVLVPAGAPLRELAVLRFLREQLPARLRGLTVGRDVHDRLKLHLIVEPAVLRIFGIDRAQVREDAVLAGVDAAARDLDR